MNNRKVLQKLIKKYNHLDFDYKTYEKGEGSLSTVMEIDGIPGEVLIEIFVYNSGTLHIYFVFDEIVESFEFYELINEYNNNSLFYTLCIRKKEESMFLEAHSCVYLDDNKKNTFDNIVFLIDYINHEDNLESLTDIFKHIQTT